MALGEHILGDSLRGWYVETKRQFASLNRLKSDIHTGGVKDYSWPEAIFVSAIHQAMALSIT
jgi:hypothetical protein